MTKELKARSEVLSERTSDAYSFDNYGSQRWTACCAMLLRRGYNEQQAEAIMRSKWTRWAADMTDRKGWRYGYTNSADLARFLDSGQSKDLAADVRELVIGTFGYEETEAVR